MERRKIMAKSIHVVKLGQENWAAKQAGATRCSFTGMATQKEAIQRATKIARNIGEEVVIHGTNGRIRDKNTVGKKDPFPPRG